MNSVQISEREMAADIGIIRLDRESVRVSDNAMPFSDYPPGEIRNDLRGFPTKAVECVYLPSG